MLTFRFNSEIPMRHGLFTTADNSLLLPCAKLLQDGNVLGMYCFGKAKVLFQEIWSWSLVVGVQAWVLNYRNDQFHFLSSIYPKSKSTSWCFKSHCDISVNVLIK